jgi:hypothetical protein
VYTRVQTPRFWGEEASAGTLDFQGGSFRPVRISCVVVAINTFWRPAVARDRSIPFEKNLPDPPKR